MQNNCLVCVLLRSAVMYSLDERIPEVMCIWTCFKQPRLLPFVCHVFCLFLYVDRYTNWSYIAFTSIIGFSYVFGHLLSGKCMLNTLANSLCFLFCYFSTWTNKHHAVSVAMGSSVTIVPLTHFHRCA